MVRRRESKTDLWLLQNPSEDLTPTNRLAFFENVSLRLFITLFHKHLGSWVHTLSNCDPLMQTLLQAPPEGLCPGWVMGMRPSEGSREPKAAQPTCTLPSLLTEAAHLHSWPVMLRGRKQGLEKGVLGQHTHIRSVPLGTFPADSKSGDLPPEDSHKLSSR